MLESWTRASAGTLALRGTIIAIALSALCFPYDFAAHAAAHFTGSIRSIMIEGQWHIVALNIALFISFLVPLSFRRKVDWKEYGLVVAFFVSLFIEMYGLPLTIYLAAGALAPVAVPDLHYVLEVPFLGVVFQFTVPMVYGTVLMVLGASLIIAGWVTLYRNFKKDALVTTGIYSVSRNPQYLGFILIIMGWLVGWPTIITVIFSVVLVIMYVRLCKVEEKETSHLKGSKGYRKRVPLIV